MTGADLTPPDAAVPHPPPPPRHAPVANVSPGAWHEQAGVPPPPPPTRAVSPPPPPPGGSDPSPTTPVVPVGGPLAATSGPPADGAVFISYARVDRPLIDPLHDDLVAGGNAVWFDREIQGGDGWWDAILEHIRAAPVFVLALSDASLRSEACRAELSYALALGLPVLAVTVRHVDVEQVPRPIRCAHVVDHVTRDSTSGARLRNAVLERVVERGPLPDPLPDPPATPLRDLDPLAEQLRTERLDRDEQRELVERLATEAQVVDQQPLVRGLCQVFLDRGDVVAQVRTDLQLLIRAIPVLEPVDRPTRNVAELDDETVRHLQRLVTHIRRERCTPILGREMSAPLVGVPDPHLVLARLPCPIYLDASPWPLMAEALREVGKDPVVDYCRWRTGADTDDDTDDDTDADEAEGEAEGRPPPVSPFDDGYQPSVERPLVYHVFGMLEVPESVVLSADDYLAFLVRVTEERDLVPGAVRRALANSALLLLGFRPETLDVRVLLHSLLSQEGSTRLERYAHLGAHPDSEIRTRSTAQAGYLERSVGRHRTPKMDIFWGSVEEFAIGLDDLWSAET